MYFGTSNVSNLTIDNITIDVLNSLGWKYSTDNQMVQIKCDDIDDTGIASAYRSHA